MRLLNPWGLAWLALIVPLVLLYLLRLRRRELTVSSVLFWSQAIQDMQANTPLQRLQRNLLLYLQIGVVVLAALALARPAISTPGLGGAAVVVVLDGSASMAAREGSRSRFELARERIGKLVDGLGRGDEAMLVLATDRAEVVHPWSSDRRALHRTLHGLAPTDLPSDLRDALTLAA
ncbi:MAG: VWA domain-containing protein, partial [Armatimonadetes bacterium]|nr:VWA domain-containing protein [Armatimonadota bacterium]